MKNHTSIYELIKNNVNDKETVILALALYGASLLKAFNSNGTDRPYPSANETKLALVYADFAIDGIGLKADADINKCKEFYNSLRKEVDEVFDLAKAVADIIKKGENSNEGREQEQEQRERKN